MALLKRAGKVAVATLLVLAAFEGLIRVAYGVRNAFVTHVPLPYVIGHDYGPTPPWLEERAKPAPPSWKMISESVVGGVAR